MQQTSLKEKKKKKQNKLLTKQNEPLQCQIFATSLWYLHIINLILFF